MPLETDPTAIDDLNPAWPINTDGVNEGDDHLRNVKTAIQGNLSGDASNVDLKLPDGTRTLETRVGLWQQIRTTVGSMVANLRNPAGGMQIAVDSAGEGRLLELDEAGGFVQNWVRLIKQEGAVLNYNNEERLRISAEGLVTTRPAGGAVRHEFRRAGATVGYVIGDEENLVFRSAANAGVSIQSANGGQQALNCDTSGAVKLFGNNATLANLTAGLMQILGQVTVRDAPTTDEGVVRKLELDGLGANVAVLEARWTGDNLAANAISANAMAVAGSPVVTRATPATETIQGSVELATAAEVKAGTLRDGVSVSPAALAGNTNVGGTQIGLAGNVQQLSGTEQPTGPGTHSVTFSRPFTSAPRVLISPYISGTASGSSNQPIVVGDSISNTGFDVYIAGDVAAGWRNFTWQAIGAY